MTRYPEVEATLGSSSIPPVMAAPSIDRAGPASLDPVEHPGATRRWKPSLLAGEGIIVPIFSTSTAIISFTFASRFWGALLVSFPGVPRGHRRQSGRWQGQQIGTSWSWAFSGAEDEETERGPQRHRGSPGGGATQRTRGRGRVPPRSRRETQ